MSGTLRSVIPVDALSFPVGSSPYEVTYINAAGDALTTSGTFTYDAPTKTLTAGDKIAAHSTNGVTITTDAGAPVFKFGDGGSQQATFYGDILPDVTGFRSIGSAAQNLGIVYTIELKVDDASFGNIDLFNRLLYSSNDYISINYDTHQLCDNDSGAVIIDYSSSNGATTITQHPSDNTTNIATTAYVMETLYDQRKIYPRSGFHFFTDFIAETSTTGTDGSLFEVISGGAATQQIPASSARVGICRMTTGAATTGRVTVSSNPVALIFGGGEWFFEAPVGVTTLSDATQRFATVVGFFDTVTGINQVDGVYFLYDEGGVSAGSTASPNWIAVTCSNSTRTFTNTGVDVTTSFQRLTIEVSADGGRAVFYIDGTEVAAVGSNIPIGAGRATGFGAGLFKSIGTTARTVDLDYVNVVNKLTTER